MIIDSSFKGELKHLIRLFESTYSDDASGTLEVGLKFFRDSLIKIEAQEQEAEAIKMALADLQKERDDYDMGNK